MAYATVVGATGYSGQETLDRILAHPELELHAVGSDTLAGKSAAELDPRLNRNGGKRVPHFVTNEAALASGADVVFVCLDHERASLLEPVSCSRTSRRTRSGATSTRRRSSRRSASPSRSSRICCRCAAV